MRLIRKKAAADGILDYDKEIRNYQIAIAWVDDFFQYLTQLRISIINFQLLDSKVFELKTPEELKSNKQSYLFTTDSRLLNNFKSEIYELKGMHEISARIYKDLKNKATSLIITLKKEYHLE